MQSATVRRTHVCPKVALHSATVTAIDRGTAIRRARKSRGLSINDLAGLTGVSNRTIGRIERGEVDKAHSLQALEEELRTELRQLAERDAAELTQALDEPGQPGKDNPRLRDATFMQTLGHLADLHAELTAELADAIRMGQPIDPSEVREWRTEDAPSMRRSPDENPPHDAGAQRG